MTVEKWSFREVLTVHIIHCFHLLSFVDVVANLFWSRIHVLPDYSINIESMDALYSRNVAPTKSKPFSSPCKSSSYELHSWFNQLLPLSAGAFLSISIWNGCVFVGIVQKNTFQACFKLSIKSHQSLALYCPTPRRIRTCSGSLQYTRSVVCFKNGES